MKTLSRFFRGEGKGFILCIIYVFVLQTSAYALPQGGVVESGTATFNQPDATTLNVNTSDKAIINWQNFNIAQNETVNFVQPSSMSAALNRVTGGGGASMINGVLNANGTIILVNPAGVNIGQSAIINVGSMQTSLTGAQAASFIASSMNISSNDFLNGQYIFAKTGMTNASVINSGMINVAGGGLVMLLGGHVANNGTINAQLGKVVLAAGDKITVNFGTRGLISVGIDEKVASGVVSIDGKEITDAVKNAGTISADGGQVLLTAEAANGIFDKAVNNEGIVKANTAIVKDGVIELVSTTGVTINSGVVQAKGTAEAPDGGKVSVYGYTAANDGVIDVSADDGGTAGYVSLLSDKGGSLLTSRSAIYANGKNIMSHAGEVLVNSEGNTFFAQNAVIDISGGTVSGDAGFAEVSAKEYIGIHGNVNGAAQEGYKQGELYIDPLRVIVDPANGDDAALILVGGDLHKAAWPGATMTFSPATIAAIAADVALRVTGDVDINSDILKINGSFTAEADNDVNVNGQLALLGGGNIIIRGKNDVNVNQIISNEEGIGIWALLGAIDVNSHIISSNNDVNLDSFGALDIAGSLQAPAGKSVSITCNNNVTVNHNLHGPFSLDINAVGTVTANNYLGVAADKVLNLTITGTQLWGQSGDQVTLNGAGTQYEYTDGDFNFAGAGTFNDISGVLGALPLVVRAPAPAPAAAAPMTTTTVPTGLVPRIINENDKTITEYTGEKKMMPISQNLGVMVQFSPISFIPSAAHNVISGATITHTLTPPSQAERVAENIAAYEKVIRGTEMEKPDEVRIITFQNPLLTTQESAVLNLDFHMSNVFFMGGGVKGVQGPQK